MALVMASFAFAPAGQKSISTTGVNTCASLIALLREDDPQLKVRTRSVRRPLPM